MNIIMIEALFH